MVGESKVGVGDGSVRVSDVDAVDLSLDPNTINGSLSLSERNRKVECVGEDQCYPDHPDRFDYWYQVLSVESLTGRCYWEVQWNGSGAATLDRRFWISIFPYTNIGFDHPFDFNQLPPEMIWTPGPSESLLPTGRARRSAC
ncbi:hypothetical protein NFI96_007534 [Prochilodus magdalenae]|nr:hypothetical protein NFI96_007534 [Prochilodus magdalenae]